MTKKINVEELPDFDLTEHLKTDENIATYLSIVLEGDDSSELMRALGVVARARGMTEVARAAGLTREALYKALRPGAQAQHAGAGSCLIVPGLRRTRRSSGRPKTAPLSSTFSAEIPPHAISIRLDSSMLDRIKGLGTQVATTASDAAQGITSSIKSGAQAVANAATSASEVINEKAVRASTAQMCSILEIAVTELKSRPLSERPVSLTATVNFGLATLEMQIHLPPGKDDETSGAEAVLPHAGT